MQARVCAAVQVWQQTGGICRRRRRRRLTALARRLLRPSVQPCGGAIPICMVEEFDLPMEIIDRRVTKMKVGAGLEQPSGTACTCGRRALRQWGELLMRAHACCCSRLNSASSPQMISPSNREVDVGKTLNEKEWIGMCRREVRPGQRAGGEQQPAACRLGCSTGCCAALQPAAHALAVQAHTRASLHPSPCPPQRTRSCPGV